MDEQFLRDLLEYLGDVGTIDISFRPLCYDINWHLFGLTWCVSFSTEYVRQTPRIRLLGDTVRQFRQQSAYGLAIVEPHIISERVHFQLGKTGFVYLSYDSVLQVYTLTWDIFDARCVMRFTPQNLRSAGETLLVGRVAQVFRAQSKQRECWRNNFG